MRLNAFGYYADFFISMALIALLAAAALTQGTLTQRAQWVLCVAAGVAGWTLLEYMIHRLLYHNVPYFIELHDAHHAKPNAFIGAPPIIGIALIFLMFFMPIVALSFVAASGITAGILAGYMAYMLVHHAAHHWNLPATSWLYPARRHHALHHHHREDGNFGITTPFWDRVFGTVHEPGPRAAR